LASDFKWPNDMNIIPHDVFGVNAIDVPDGFLPPGKSNGNVYVITTDPNDITGNTTVYQLTTLKSGFFYH